MKVFLLPVYTHPKNWSHPFRRNSIKNLPHLMFMPLEKDDEGKNKTEKKIANTKRTNERERSNNP